MYLSELCVDVSESSVVSSYRGNLLGGASRAGCLDPACQLVHSGPEATRRWESQEEEVATLFSRSSLVGEAAGASESGAFRGGGFAIRSSRAARG